MGGLDSDTPITRSIGGHQESSVGQGVEDGNDFTDRIEYRADRSLFVIRVRHLIQSTRKSIRTLISLPLLSCSDPAHSRSKKHGHDHSNVPLVGGL